MPKKQQEKRKDTVKKIITNNKGLVGKAARAGLKRNKRMRKLLDSL